MAELELALRRLGREVEWPDEPALAAAVAARLRADATQERRRSLRPFALAVAALVAALAIALAVPPARSAILDFFGIGGVEIRRVETLPSAQAPLPLGERVSLEAALARSDFGVRVPVVAIENVYLDASIPGGRVSFVWHENGRRLVLSEFAGDQLPLFEKQVGPRTRVTAFEFRGSAAAWIEGAEHVVYRDRRGRVHSEPSVAGDVLLWDRGGITYRVEGAPTRARALEILGTLRPLET